MTTQADDDAKAFVVVINDEEQYSIWSADKPLPAGWRDGGKRGTKAECLDHIEKVWTDMRPLSVRRDPPAPARPLTEPPRRAPGGKNDLVARLEASQPISFVARPEPSRAQLKAQLDRGRVFVRFDKTGTELGVKIGGPTLAAARAAADESGRADATIKLEGELVLNYNRVTFVGELDLSTFRGTGHLVYVGDA